MARAAYGPVFGRAAKVEPAVRLRCVYRLDFTGQLPPPNNEKKFFFFF